MANSKYAEKFKDPRWQKMRLKVFEKAGWRCQNCDPDVEDRELHLHHGYYEWGIEPWDLPEDTLWCLCDECHKRAQKTFSEMKLEIGRTNPMDYDEIYETIREAREQWDSQRRDNCHA